MHHGGVEHRRGIGEAGGLDDHPGEGGAAIVEIAQQPLQRLDEVAAERAAQASGGQQHDIFVDLLDQQVIEADLAELVDDDRGVGERGIAQQAIEQRRLAGAEKAGQHGQRKRWARRSRGIAPSGHCASVRGGPAGTLPGFGLTAATVGLGVFGRCRRLRLVAVAGLGSAATAFGFSVPAGLGWSVAVGFGLSPAAWRSRGLGGVRRDLAPFRATV